MVGLHFPLQAATIPPVPELRPIVTQYALWPPLSGGHDAIQDVKKLLCRGISMKDHVWEYKDIAILNMAYLDLLVRVSALS